MIKILILSRSDLHPQRRDIPQYRVTMSQINNEAYTTGQHYHYVIFQEGDGPVSVLRDREDYPLKTLLEEVIRELPKENE